MTRHSNHLGVEFNLHELRPIGVVHSPFRQKFGIPRQSGLLSDVKAKLELFPPYSDAAWTEGITAHSHLWLIFCFHATWALNVPERPQVRPPRLGGNQKVGVFATRSMFRPNDLGLSLAKLARVEATDQGVLLHLTGLDLLDGTPVYDIKPYVPYSDCIPQAHSTLAPHAPEPGLSVMYSKEVLHALSDFSDMSGEDLTAIFKELIQFDPRPAYKAKTIDQKIYHTQYDKYEVSWSVVDDVAQVSAVRMLGK